jgi:hypothetical protein
MFPMPVELGIIIAFPPYTESCFDPAHQSSKVMFLKKNEK